MSHSTDFRDNDIRLFNSIVQNSGETSFELDFQETDQSNRRIPGCKLANVMLSRTGSLLPLVQPLSEVTGGYVASHQMQDLKEKQRNAGTVEVPADVKDEKFPLEQEEEGSQSIISVGTRA